MDLLIEKKKESDLTSTLSTKGDEVEEKKVETCDYVFNTNMLDFIKAIKNKYRIYVLTNIPSTPDKEGEEERIKKVQK